MKRKLLYTATLITAIIIIFKTIVLANSTGAVYGICGAPDDQAPNACGTGGCHNFTPIQDDPSLKITMLDPSGNVVTAYNLNVKYTIRVELTRASLRACGFEATVESASDNKHVGTYLPKLKSQITFGNNNYVTHINSSRTSTGYGKWEFYWTSPKTDPGDVIVYAAGNDANGDANSTGDSIFTTTTTYSHNSGINVAAASESNVSVFPNPAKDNFTVSYDLNAAGSVNIDLYNIKGQFVTSIQEGLMQAGNNKALAHVSGFAPGVYYVKVLAGEQESVQKVLIGN